MLTTNQLIKYLRDHHNINVKKGQAQDLRNIGYYHGYKGYRFIRVPSNKINFTSLNEVIALNKFDMELKALFYPKIMFIENALKSYVIEAVLEDSKSEDLDLIFNKSVTGYRVYEPGSFQYKKQYSKRIMLIGKINNTLLRDYQNGKPTVNHFFDMDRKIPIWAVFESLTLGEFGTFFHCLNLDVKKKVSQIMKWTRSFDQNGKTAEYVIYTIKDLRNAVAHNNAIFDCRFKNYDISKRLISLLEREAQIEGIDFKYIDSYIILVTFVLRKMGESAASCRKFANSFFHLVDKLKESIKPDVCNRILGNRLKTHHTQLTSFISKY